MSWLVLALGCSVPAEYAEVESTDVTVPADTGTEDVEAPAEQLAMDAAWLRRVSMDLRGFPPTEDELEALEQDPSSWRSLRDTYLEEDHLNERLVHIFAERWHTRVDVFDIEVFDYGLPATLEYAFERAVGEEPLRIMSRVVTEDLPWSDIVLADWTMANDILASVWPLDYPSGETGWTVKMHRWTSRCGRTGHNGLWWRYNTDESNMNRRRAAAISKLLLCEDYLVRPVAFSEADTTTEATADAVHSDPYCLACHASSTCGRLALWLLVAQPVLGSRRRPHPSGSLQEQFLGVEPPGTARPSAGSQIWACPLPRFHFYLRHRDLR